MTTIGLVGIENSHATHFVRLLNVEQRHPGARATALVKGAPERTAELADLGDVPELVEEPSDLVGRVDAAIVSTRDGARHLEHARPLLEAGMPVLVDKPLAASVDDARELVALARDHDAPLLSCSALRFLPQLADLRPTERTGALRHLQISGPADPADQYSGLFFYGIHLVETAMEILDNPDASSSRRAPAVLDGGQGAIVATSDIAGVPVSFVFIAPSDGHKAPFSVTAAYEDAVLSHELDLGRDYNAGALKQFIDLVAGRVDAPSSSYLLSPVVILSGIIEEYHDALKA